MKKRLLAIICSLSVCLSLVPCVFAASSEQQKAADDLYILGLFNGTGTLPDGSPNFDLDRTPTRNEAVTMLVRLLGAEEEAQSRSWNIPFVDVADWARPYVGYAYENGLTNGTSTTTFGGEEFGTANQYATFVLRSLGYSDDIDFEYTNALQFFEQLDNKDINYATSGKFTRGDVALMSYNALSCNISNASEALISMLVDAGTIEDWQIMYYTDLLEAANAITLQTPSNVRIERQNGTDILTWDAVNSKCIYNVYYKESGDSDYRLLSIVPVPYVSLDSNNINIIDEILPNTDYLLTVRAILDNTDTGEKLRQYSYYSDPVLYNSTNEIESTNNAPYSVISSVLSLVAESAQKQQDALILCQSALAASASAQGLYFAELAQEDFVTSQTALYNALQQCRNYDNLQDCVVPMATAHSLLAPTTGTVITQSNYLEYVVDSINFSSMAADYFDEFVAILVDLNG